MQIKLEDKIKIPENAPFAVYMISNCPDLSVLSMNSFFYKLIGFDKEEFQVTYGNKLAAILDNVSLDEFQDKVTRKNESEPVQLEQHIVRPDKKDFWMGTVLFPVDRRELFYCISFDISNYKKTENNFAIYKAGADLVGRQVNIEVFTYNLKTQTAKIVNTNIIPLEVSLTEQQVHQSFQEAVIKKGIVHPDFIKKFRYGFRQVLRGEAVSVCELKLKNWEGEYIWYRFKLERLSKEISQGEYAIGILENISKEKEVSLNYLNEKQFYHSLLSDKEAYGQVDVTDNVITKIGGIWNLYNELIHKVSYSHLINEFINKVVHPEDRKHYLDLMQCENMISSFRNGVDRLGCEFRRIVDQNKMVWMELGVRLFREPLTDHIVALVYLENIDDKKKQEMILRYESERDNLTKLYNKKIGESLVRQYINTGDTNINGAFIVLDIDCFKDINDNYGHQAGDKVLIHLAANLNETFLPDSIIFRFGGDEFIVFMKNAGSKSKVKEALRKLWELVKGETEPEFSVSIGIAMYTKGITYEQLFLQADTALYSAKNEGKKREEFYHGQELIYPEHRYSAKTDLLLDKDIIYENQMITIKENDGSFEDFVGYEGDLAYMVDPVNFTLICANNAFYSRLGMTKSRCDGMKCYEILHKRKNPCPFCSKANWTSDKFYMWRNLNNVLEQEFLIKNKLVQWRGKEALLALAVDISNNQSIVDSLENGATESHSVISGIQRMAEAPDLESAMLVAMESIGIFFRADRVHFWECKNNKGPFVHTYQWQSKKPESTFRTGSGTEKKINQWIRGQNWMESIYIENPEAMLCYSYEMYQFMEECNIKNHRWIPLREGEEIFGFIVIDNLTANFENVSFMESFSAFLISERKKRSLMEEVIYVNEHDTLTNLLNRRSYEKYLQNYHPDDINSIGVIIVNINGMRKINTSVGTYAGDNYIRQLAALLKKIFHREAIFRFNGDEFLIIAENIKVKMLEKQMKELSRELEKINSFTVASGYAWDNVEKDLTLLCEHAAQVMAINKKRFHDTHTVSNAVNRQRMLQNIIKSIENNEFEVFLQPKIELSSNCIIGAEALIRYHDKEKGIISPSQFIDILEKNKFIRYVDLFVFRKVCELLEEWRQKDFMPLVISFNFSRLTILEENIVSSMENIVSQYGFLKNQLEIEITESVADMGKSVLYQVAKELKHTGYAIALDDFGTKYTNLSILSDLELDVLKLDKSLVHELSKQEKSRVIVKNVISMCKDLKIDVIAEGVETLQQEEILKNLKCRWVQGYLHGKPMTIEEFTNTYLKDGRK